ncbi:MAG: class I SAM-dependent methyltransferase [bacterium]
MERYTEAIKADQAAGAEYYAASLNRKTEQQKALESLLRTLRLEPATIADIACGGGGTSYHLGALYPAAAFTLVDMNEEAIALASDAVRGLDARCVVGSVYDLQLESNSFDLVICWQAISWFDNPERALHELIRICKPGGRVYASSLFNVEHDVDIYANVEDHTRPSSAQGMRYAYNTYSLTSIRKWVGHLVSHLAIHEFEIPIDIPPSGRGLGTFTVRLDNGKRLQLSAGMLLNWGILDLRK